MPRGKRAPGFRLESAAVPGMRPQDVYALVNASDPRIAPDGTRVFHKLDSVGWTGDRRKHVFVVDVAGGEVTQLTSGDFEHDNPCWSPDGTRIAFDGLRDERWDAELINRLYVVDAAGGEPQPL